MKARSRKESSVLALLALVFCVGASAEARAWEPFRRENPEVARGNRALERGDSKAALEAYDAAASRLPESAGLQLNRGLAMLAAGKLPDARKALLKATEPPASASLRSAAYYNLGVAFFREGETLADQNDAQGAQRSFHEAVDSFKRALRAKPGERDAAWNLEVARRRLQEEREKQEKQEREKQEQEQQEREQQEQQDQDGQDPSQDGEEPSPDGQEPSQKGQDPSPDPGQAEQDEPEPAQQDSGDGPEASKGAEEEPKPDDSQPDSSKPDREPGPEGPQGASDDGPSSALPEHGRRLLDHLQEGEESYQQLRARTRGAREKRRVEKDW